MKFDPEKFDPRKLDLNRYFGPKGPSEADKRHGSFNRRMIAASIDTLLITLLIAPMVDMLFIRVYGPPTVDVFAISQYAATQSDGAQAAKVFLSELKSSGYLDRWIMNMRWHLYALLVVTMFCWQMWSATPGKMLCRLKIVDAKTGAKASFIQHFLRAGGYILSGLPLGLGFFWIMIDKKRRGWHDYFAGTMVLRVRKETTSAPEAAHPSGSPAPSEAE